MSESVPLKEAICMKLEEQLLYILELCENSGKDTDRAVHETRRSFKKCRSLLRLIRDTMGYAAYYRENCQLRDMQRTLSAARDASVLVSQLGDVEKAFPDHPRGDWWKKLRSLASARQEHEYEEIRNNGCFDRIAGGTGQAMKRMKLYSLDADGFGLIEGGLSRIYRQGKEMTCHLFEGDADVGTLHEFRKKAKYLQYQLLFLTSVFPGLIKPTTKSFKKLTDSLGQYHDLYNVQVRLSQMTSGNRQLTGHLPPLFDRLNVRMKEVLEYADVRARKLYVESTVQFVSRIRSYWDIYYQKHEFELINNQII
jgi:CHAD domain-containing protein